MLRSYLPKVGREDKAEIRSDQRKKHFLVTHLHHPQKGNALIMQANYSSDAAMIVGSLRIELYLA